MTDPFANYRTDTLILLMGENPLPNYVAANLLANTNTRLLLVHSGETRKQRDRLKKVLESKDYTFGNNNMVEVKESDPANIFNVVTGSLKDCTGRVGLNYTGGTKAMAVHAYRALEMLDDTKVAEKLYSYLDARSLSMVFNDGQNSWSEPIGTLVPVNLLELLKLHGLEKLKKEPSEEVRWPETTQALLAIYSNLNQHKEWREWCSKNGLNDQKGPDNSLPTDEFPQSIRESLERDNPTLTFPVPFDALVEAGNFKPEKGRSAPGACGQWFIATWLEEYVFRKVREIQTEQSINDLKMSIEPELGPVGSFEFDIVFMRGHQLFGISCSTMDKVAPLKEKLLEVAVRASQLGGGETCFALVSCAEGKNLTDLQHQLGSLTNLNKRRIRVFGRKDLLNLQTHLKEWIKEASQY